MPLTLEKYDSEVGFHLRMIRHHLAYVKFHSETMTHRPDFETQAEDDMEKCRDALAQALGTINHAIGVYKAKPVDG